MVAGTVLAVLLVPLFFVVIRSAFRRRHADEKLVLGQPAVES
jgi:hypothetical protein